MLKPAAASNVIWAEADRLAALRDLEILDTSPETSFDDIAELAALICQAPVALISFVDEKRVCFKSHIGLPVEEAPAEGSICARIIRGPESVVIPDLTNDPRFSQLPFVTGEPFLRFYAGALLVTDNGLPLGTLCVLDHKPRLEGLTHEQSKALQVLARSVMRLLDLKRASKEHWTTIAEAIPQQLWSARPDGSIDYCSSRVFEFTGMALGAADEIAWVKLIHPDERDQAIAQWRHSIETGEPYKTEYRIRHRSGEYRWVLVQAVPSYNSTGKIERWFGTSTDIHAAKTFEATLARSEEQHRALLEASSVVLWVATPDGMIYETRGWENITGQDRSEYAGLGSFDVVHSDDLARVSQAWKDAVAEGASYEAECRIRQKNGEYHWMLTRAVPIKDADGSIREWVGSISDIHDRKQAEEQLRASEERLKLALYAGRMVAWDQDLLTGSITSSDNALELFGIGPESLQAFLERIHPDDCAGMETLAQQVGTGSRFATEFRYSRANGEMLWLRTRAERAGPNRIIGITYDISDRKAAEKELWHVANHDALTGLPNRAHFQQRLERALVEAQQNSTSVSLLLIDLDHFKDVNDALGHDAGDALLKATAERLLKLVRDSDMVARFGGDEFAVIVMEPLTLADANRLANRLIEQLSQPFEYSGRTFASKASIGIAAFPDHGSTAMELLKDADIALYRAKADGRNRVVTYSSMLRFAIEQRLALAEEVRQAISKQEIIPFYQPKVSLSTGKITGFEALARWRHPTKGLLTPAAFAAMFDDPELAMAIGRQILTKVASDLRGWLDHGLDLGRIAVNLSSAQFNDLGLVDEILGILDDQRVSPCHLEVEVTETVLLGRQGDIIAANLNRFHERGILIALDDFGTGYASLTHLKQFPVGHVKIDRSFIEDLVQDEGDEAIVAAITGLGKSLKMQITAEGVETQEQVQRLRALGCHNAQGYFYSKPMDAADVPRFLQTFRESHAPLQDYGI